MLVMAGLFILYIAIHCKIQPQLGPALPKEELNLAPGATFGRSIFVAQKRPSEWFHLAKA